MTMSLMQGGAVYVCRRALGPFLAGSNCICRRDSESCHQGHLAEDYESLLFGVPMQFLQLLYCCNLHLVT